MRKQIKIEGMTCGHCSARVEKALNAMAGVTEAKVDLANKTATINITQDIDDNVLREAIDDAGYDVAEIKSI